MEITKEFQRCYDLLEEGKNIIITGKAGTGKSTFIKWYTGATKKNVALLSFTAIAANNIGGQTIHSFFKFPARNLVEYTPKFRDNVNELVKKVDLIIIDEMSMLRADVLDALSESLQIHKDNVLVPFGGVQIAFIGDLMQLPPVVTQKEKHFFKQAKNGYKNEYFFSAYHFHVEDFEYVELTKVFRQTDLKYIEALNNVRVCLKIRKSLNYLNKRVKSEANYPENNAVILTFTNKVADSINAAQLEKLETERHIFVADYEEAVKLAIEAKDYVPIIPETTEFKVGAKVLMRINTANYFNGSIGVITKIDTETQSVYIDIFDGSITKSIKVEKYAFEVSIYQNVEGKLKYVKIGEYKQFPFILAYAITIHKSQGMTFESVYMSMGNNSAFSTGQVYVGLSRCKTYEGLFLDRPLRYSDILENTKVNKFLGKIKAVEI